MYSPHPTDRHLRAGVKAASLEQKKAKKESKKASATDRERETCLCVRSVGTNEQMQCMHSLARAQTDSSPGVSSRFEEIAKSTVNLSKETKRKLGRGSEDRRTCITVHVRDDVDVPSSRPVAHDNQHHHYPIYKTHSTRHSTRTPPAPPMAAYGFRV